MSTVATYGPSTVKRSRSTKAELQVLDDAIVEAVEQDTPVTLRGVFYRVVSAGAVEKSENGYRKIGRRLIKLREDGRVPYGAITDGTRLMRRPETWDRVETMLQDAAASYRRALWDDQDVEVMILSEKDAITGAVLPITFEWVVELGIVRGYASVTFRHSVAQTIRANASRGKPTFVYQLGDHDPSGLDAWRSFKDGVLEFLPDRLGGLARTEMFVPERLAVTPAQIEDLQLQTRPTKRSDSRARDFVGESVEVDAIPAATLRQIVRDAIVQHIDEHALRMTLLAEDSEREVLSALAAGRWSE